MEKREYTAAACDAGTRLDVLAAAAFSVTRASAQKAIEEARLTVGGAEKEKNYKVRTGDLLTLILPDARPAEAEAQDLPLGIVYQDDWLAVVNKPKGMVVHPAPGNPDRTLVNALLYHLDGLSGVGGVLRPGIVHRIDKNTSGLLMVAKNDEAHLALSAQIKDHSFLRRYEAILVGNLKEDEGTIDAPIGRHPVKRKQMAVTPDGRPARTDFRVLERFSGFCRVELTLHTGRTHQIRVHTAHLGHPVLGDTLYGGGKTPFEKKHKDLICEQTLHARDLGFIHPKTGEYMEFSAAPPEYFVRLEELLRGILS
ncbi:MAG: RluA family pseudouridine synthase [Clostridia bacterium]|nr:RluA family pseudouridine synthase [Clostridia bacterium]